MEFALRLGRRGSIVRPEMRILFHLSLTIAALLAASGCESTMGSGRGRNLNYGEDAEENYNRALDAMRGGRCLEAEPAFRRIRRDFPYSEYAALSELRIADCKLEQDEYAEAIAAYQRFIAARPTHEQVPYARFKIAESHYRQIPDGWFMSPPDHERDQGPTRNALRQLRRFIVEHPDSERVAEAQRMVERCLRLLAEHEMYVARFYQRRGADRAVVGRLRTLLTSYQGSGLEAAALLMLGRAHVRLDQRDDARQAFQELIERYPEAAEVSEARSELTALGS